jgi:hypothetical protein
MNPGIYPDFSSMQTGTVKVPVQWTSGGTGAVPALSAFKYKAGITSVTRNSAGLFTIVFPAACKGIFGVYGNVVQASYSASGAVSPIIKANNMTVLGTHSIQIQTSTAAGAAVDPASGDVIMLVFDCQWSNPI